MQTGNRLRETLGALQNFVEGLLQYLRVQQLLAVLPFVDGLGLVETLVALQADKRKGEHLGGGLGEFSLADPRGTFDEHRLAEVVRQVDGGRDLVAADVSVRLEAQLQGIHRLRQLLDVCHESSETPP